MRIVSILFLFIILIVGAYSLPLNDFQISEGENEGYIVQYKEKPLGLKESELKESAFENAEKIEKYSDYNPVKYVYSFFTLEPEEVSDAVDRHEVKLDREHSRVKREIIDELDSSFLTGNVVKDYYSIIVEEYKDSFNGALVLIDEKDVEKISSLDDVKAVYPNSKLELNLDKSIPFLNLNYAPIFTDARGRPLLGDDVKVAIIDSGVDYTHPDFGSCFGENVPTASLPDDFSFDGNFLAYSSLQPNGCFDYDSMFSREYVDANSLTKALISAYDGALCLNSYEELDDNLVELLELRKELFINAIQEDPDSALEVPQLTQKIVFQLSSQEKENLIEDRGEYEGYLEIWHIDDFENYENSYFEYKLSNEEKTFDIFRADELGYGSGTKLKLNGVSFDDSLAVSSSPEESPIVLEAPPDLESVGEQNTLVIILDSDVKKLDSSITFDSVKRTIFNDEFRTVKDFYDENSFDKVDFKGDVVGIYMYPESDCYKSGGFNKNALALAENDVIALGKTLKDYGRVILIIPPSLCGHIVSGTLGKTNTILPDGSSYKLSFSYIFYNNLFHYEHELGHNLGAQHSNSFNCYTSNRIKTSFSFECNSQEYGDGMSVMGYGGVLSHHTAYDKYEFGWFDENNVMTTEEGIYSLAPLEYPTDEIQLIRIPITYETNKVYFYNDLPSPYYTIEFRQPSDYETFNSAGKSPDSIRIHVVRFSRSEERSYSLSPYILYPEGGFMQFLSVGKEFIDRINGVAIKLNSVTGSGESARAEVSIRKIPQDYVDLQKPLIHYSFDESISNGVYLKDESDLIRGALVFGGINELGGIGFDGVGLKVNPNTLERYAHANFSSFAKDYFDNGEEFSISLWTYFKGYPAFSATIYEGPGLILEINNFGKINFKGQFDHTNTMPVFTFPNKVNLNEWNHIAVVGDGTNVILYLNGV